MKSGHVSIENLNNWHKSLDYSLHPNPLTGFNPLDVRDLVRYKSESINVYIGRSIGSTAIKYFTDYFNWISNHAFSIQKLNPGMLLPWHTDQYSNYRRINGVDDVNKIIRVIVFLEDWQRGHISEVDHVSNSNYKAGDWISWTGTTPHMAANLGHSERYTLQITGTVN